MSITQINDLLNSETVNWCDRLSSNEKESCENIQIEAIQETYEELEGLLGDDISDWTWGAVHHVLLFIVHLVQSKVWILYLSVK
ncbi:penicillin acylase family protein [Pseudoalteromonas sp. B62]|uniref:penicillin acylase family protein n=1 Tax=Pseudoalteromonas sp. B62 TaxID=630483 RepID=UPI003FA68707